jgi:hypothetical protein
MAQAERHGHEPQRKQLRELEPMPGVKPFSRVNTIQHTLARMLPLFRYQMQVYRLAEINPPAGDMDGYGPVWEAVSFVLGPLGSLQARVNVQRDFTCVAMSASSSVLTAAGGFRVQLFDTKKQLRFADRGVHFTQFAGNPPGARFLRDPYCFDQPDSQVLVMVQNLETSANTIQIALYGQCLRFNQASNIKPVFPGGSIMSPPAEDTTPPPPPGALSQAVSDFLSNAADPTTRSVLKSLL